MKALLFAFVILFSGSIARADIPKPKVPKKAPKYELHASLEISTDPKAYEAKLQISESTFKDIRAGLADRGGSAPIVGGLALSSTRTILAGLLMFMSVSVAGVMLARSSTFGRTQKAIAALFLVAVLIGAAAIITHGNAGPPGSYRWRNLPQALAEGKPTIGGVDLEIVPDSEISNTSIRLVLPLKKQGANGEE